MHPLLFCPRQLQGLAAWLATSNLSRSLLLQLHAPLLAALAQFITQVDKFAAELKAVQTTITK
jgi:hypothetical protein